jgi:glycosyltransferase involved in cell wall biosynthesis
LIIWLASYPRSGNTLLRTVLKQTMNLGSYSDETYQSALGFNDFIKESFGYLSYPQSWESFYEEASSSSDIFLVKTHHLPRDGQPAIYVVRDGRAATESYAAFHKSFTTDGQNKHSILDLMLGDDYYGDWSNHFNAWNSRDNGELLLVRFEELVNADINLLEKLKAFVQFNNSIQPFNNPIKTLRSENPNFFRTGNIRWQNSSEWNDYLKDMFIALHGDLLVKLNYIESSEQQLSLGNLNKQTIELAHLANQAFIERNNWHYSANAKEKVIQSLTTLNDKTLAQLVTDNIATEPLYNTIGISKVEHSDQTNCVSTKKLEEKEKVIQELLTELVMWRRVFKLLRFLWYPIKLTKGVINRIRNKLFRLTSPNLSLSQHEPKCIVLSENYTNTTTLSHKPKVSIVTPSFKQANYIKRTIDSVLNQNYPNLEYFIQDGYSQDGTGDILRDYGSAINGWESAVDRGQSHAINLGFARTDGEIMAWLNSDDILLPDAINTIVEYFNQHPDVDVIYGDRLLIDENDMKIGRWILPKHDNNVLSWADFVPQETLFWRRSIWEKAGGKIDESFKFAMDWDLLVRFRDAGAKFVHIPQFIGAFRIHSNQKTSTEINETGFKEMNQIRQRLIGHVPTQKEIRKAIFFYILKHICVDRMHSIKLKFAHLKQ